MMIRAYEIPFTGEQAGVLAEEVINLIADELGEIWQPGQNEVGFQILRDGQVQMTVRGYWGDEYRIESFMLNGPQRERALMSDVSESFTA